MQIGRSRVAAGALVALGGVGAALLATRQIVPTAEVLLNDTGPLMPLPSRKPNAYVDAGGRSPVALASAHDARAGARRAIELLGGLGPIDVAGRRVLVKPSANSGYPSPASTSPAALEGVIQMLQDHGAADVIVGEMSGPPWHDTTKEMARNGLLDVIENNGAHFVDFRYDRWVNFDLGGRARHFATLAIPRTVYEAERIVAIPALKTHFLAGFSLGLKIWFGAVHPRQRLLAHASRDLAAAIAEMNLAFQPDLTLIDGSRALVSGGPKKGESVVTDLFLASGDRVALDACGAAILGSYGRWPAVADVPVWEQPQIERAIELNLGVRGPESLALIVDDAAAGSERLAAARREIDARVGLRRGRAI